MALNISGFILVDTPHSALNNAGADVGSMTENTVAVKTIKKGGKTYPYISGQALRYWWRESLKEKCGWNLSPIERDKKIAFTKANPFEYEDDDVFGYMKAQKDKEGGTVTRLSPLKCSPLVSVCEHKPINDFGVMGRQEGDPVPYEHQFYSTIMKGIFSLNISDVGAFYTINRTGYKNLPSDIPKEYNAIADVDVEGRIVLKRDIRVKRIKDTISVLPYLNGGAKQAAHLTDVSPKFIILAILDCGNNIFMNIVDEARPYVNINSIMEVIKDYQDSIISPVFIGKRKGFLDELDEDLTAMAGTDENIRYDTLNTIIELFAEQAEKYVP